MSEANEELRVGCRVDIQRNGEPYGCAEVVEVHGNADGINVKVRASQSGQPRDLTFNRRSPGESWYLMFMKDGVPQFHPSYQFTIVPVAVVAA